MPVNENQLDIWSRQGSVSQSQSTYATIRSVLEGSDSAYSDKQYTIFLQGSYGNDTNVYADSDVDVVIRLSSTYYYDLDALSAEQKTIYNASRSVATYSYDDFKKEVISQLAKRFGSSVKPGNKAIYIEGNGSRRDADVVAATEYRKYLNFQNSYSQNYVEGICFWTSNGTQIINYPKQHSANCTAKHQATRMWFKPMVRILKNMRNSMIDRGYLKDGIAPSYFLEGMLYNVPNDKFGRTYADTFANAVNWLIDCDRTKLECANEQYYLIHPTSLVTWRAEKMEEYLNAVTKFWREY